MPFANWAAFLAYAPVTARAFCDFVVSRGCAIFRPVAEDHSDHFCRKRVVIHAEERGFSMNSRLRM